MGSLFQILAWVAIPDETEEDEQARNFTMDMGNKIMDGIWDMVEDNWDISEIKHNVIMSPLR